MTPKLGIGLCLTSIAALSFAAGHAQAQQCSTLTTQGRYVVVASGFIASPSAATHPLVPAKLLATATADESGDFKGKGILMVGGGPALVQTVNGTETINGDCTGHITYATTLEPLGDVGNGLPPTPGPPLHFNFVVSQHGNRIDGLATDAGTVLAAVLTRISPKHQEGDTDASRSTQARPAMMPVRLQPKALPRGSAAAARNTARRARASGLSAVRRSG